MDRKYEWQEENRRQVPEITVSKDQEFQNKGTLSNADNPDQPAQTEAEGKRASRRKI